MSYIVAIPAPVIGAGRIISPTSFGAMHTRRDHEFVPTPRGQFAARRAVTPVENEPTFPRRPEQVTLTI